MSSVTYNVFEHDRSVFKAVEQASTETRLAFSGVLQEERVLDVATSTSSYVIAAAVRDGRLTVTLNYQSFSESYEVIPGRPMVLETLDITLSEQLANITLTPVAGSDIEIVIQPGVASNVALPPLDAVLVLNASTGLTLSGDQVLSWQDTRASATLTDPFTPTKASPRLLSSDPDFNGQPSLTVENYLGALAYTGDAADFSFMGQGAWSMLIVLRANDYGNFQTMVSNAGTDGGMQLAIEGGHRPYVQTFGVAGNPNYTDPILPNILDTDRVGKARAVAVVLSCNGPGSTIDIHYQDNVRQFTGTSVSAAASDVLTVLGNVGNTDVLNGAVAEIRIYDRAITTLEILDCNNYATAQFGVVQVAAKQPVHGAYANFKSCRGVSLSGEAAFRWADTRFESTSEDLGASGGDNPIFQAVDPIFEGPSITVGTSTGQGYLLLGDPALVDFLASGPYWICTIFAALEEGSGNIFYTGDRDETTDTVTEQRISSVGPSAAVPGQYMKKAGTDTAFLTYTSFDLEFNFSTPVMLITQFDEPDALSHAFPPGVTESFVNIPTTPDATVTQAARLGYGIGVAVAEVFVFNAPLTPSQITTMQNYAAARYGA